MATIRGGKKFEAAMAKLSREVSGKAVARVGFLAKSKYPDGTPVAMIAAINEFGAPSRGQPPRPFFRRMIADKQGEWPAAIAGLFRASHDIVNTMDKAGAAIARQLKQSIQDLVSPPLAQSTIDRKGHDKPLIDTGFMWNSVDHEVKTG